MRHPRGELSPLPGAITHRVTMRLQVLARSRCARAARSLPRSPRHAPRHRSAEEPPRPSFLTRPDVCKRPSGAPADQRCRARARRARWPPACSPWARSARRRHSQQLRCSRRQAPGHLHEAAGQRCGVAQRVADKFAQNEAGVTRRNLENAGLGEVADQAPASNANARGCIREHPHARRTHLHEHPAPSVELYEPGMSGNAPCAHGETVNARFPECYVPQCPGLSARIECACAPTEAVHVR